MTEIVLNEKQWVEDAIATSSFNCKPAEALGRFARYYHELGYKKAEVEKMLEEFMIRCDPNINIVRWQEAISRCVKYAWKNTLIQIEPITITQSELDLIGKLTGVMRQKLMFALLCLSKYGNAVSEKNNSWVNRDIKDIVALSNTKITIRRQSLLFNDLREAGYIGFSNVVDNVNVNVKIVDSSGADAVMRIDDFRNLGNQYMMHVYGGYMKCQQCDLVVKRNSPNQKYCKSCAADVNLKKTSEKRAINAA